MKINALTLFLAVALTPIAAVLGQEAPSPFASAEPWAPTLVQDAVMPRQGQVAETALWLRRAFANDGAAPRPKDGVRIVVERQDYSRLRFNESCVAETFEFPNGVRYAKGLGTHANSRLRVVAPEPIARFTASAGIAQSKVNGSVRFAVADANERKLFETDVVRGGEDARKLDVVFDPPVDEFLLLVDATEDGPSYDQANWLEPVATTAQGKRYDLVDDAVVARFDDELPFSFLYDGKSSREFLASWQFSEKRIDDNCDAFSWTDPDSGLVVTATTRRFPQFAAADWVLTFTNSGSRDSGIVSEVCAFDLNAHYGFENKSLAIHTLTGDSCDERSWLPKIERVKPGETRAFAPTGGRSSNGAFPFWNIMSREYDDSEPSEGLFVALGWSGQWSALFSNLADSKSTVKIQAGMAKLATILRPGESIRSPRALVMPWRGIDRLTAHALFRRLLMFNYAPHIDGKPVKLEIISQCFDRYYRKRPGWEKVEAQIETARMLKRVGGTAYWFDAAWFPKGFPTGVGSWRSDLENFPNGVEELSAELDKLGLKFVLWFEPERVAPETDIAKEHPEYVFGGEKGGLYKLNDPEAREYLTSLLLKRIKEFGVDVYRNDFNLDPLPYWRAADEPNRVGMTEIRYVEGHYEMWNRLREENPGLWIDDCASGGRRIDLETISISVPLWRSDTCCWPGHPEWDQNQTLGIALYLPLYSCVAWDPSPYTFRSAANAGVIMQYNFLDADFDETMTRASIEEGKRYQKFWYGDFYPMTDAVVGKKSVTAWQLHRSDLDAGLVYAFRQSDSPYLGLELQLRALEPQATYRCVVKRDYDLDGQAQTVELPGDALAKLPVLFSKSGEAIVVEYEKVQK